MTGKFDIAYERSRDGMLVARIGGDRDQTYAAVPRRAGGFIVAPMCSSRRHFQISQSIAEDYHSRTGLGLETAPDEAGFRRAIEYKAMVIRQEASFRREDLPPGQKTPLGVATRATKYAEGVIKVKGQSRDRYFDGFLLSPARNDAIPPSWRLPDRFYGNLNGSDAIAARVVASFPDIFTDEEKRRANYYVRYPENAGGYPQAMRDLAARGIDWEKMAAADFRSPVPKDTRNDDASARNYRVRWEIDIEASSPREAAARAGEIMQTIDHAPCFDVKGPDGKITHVDLVPRNDADAWRLLDMRREKRLAEIEELDERRSSNNGPNPSF